MKRKEYGLFTLVGLALFMSFTMLVRGTNDVPNETLRDITVDARRDIAITEYNGFTLTWRWHDFGHWASYMLETVEGNGVIAIYEYDQFGNRIIKNVNGCVTRFYYEEFYERFYLVREVSAFAELEFIYSIYQGRAGTPFKIPTGVVINEIVFEYYKRYDVILGMIDPNGTLVVMYEYEQEGPFWNMVAEYILIEDNFVNIEHVDLSDLHYLQNILRSGVSLTQDDYALLASLNNIEFNGYTDNETGWTLNSFGDLLNRQTNTFVPRPNRTTSTVQFENG